MWRYLFAGCSFLVPALFDAETKAAPLSCSNIGESVESARNAGNLGLLGEILATARSGGTDCSPIQVFCLGRTVSRAHVEEAYRRFAQGRTEAELKPLLEDGFRAGPTWQSAFALAEAEEAGRPDDLTRYDRAARYYQLAINDIDEIDRQGEVCPGDRDMLPDSATAKLILDRATNASRLATTFVKPPATRSGEPGGIFIASFRGVTAEATPVPVTFEFDSADFTPKGREAAEFLVGYVKSRQLKEVFLAGHTDSKGSEAYNCELSRRRLQAVSDFLVRAGYSGDVSIDPRGESQPAVLDDPGRYSQDDREALDRRVELLAARPTASPCG